MCYVWFQNECLSQAGRRKCIRREENKWSLLLGNLLRALQGNGVHASSLETHNCDQQILTCHEVVPASRHSRTCVNYPQNTVKGTWEVMRFNDRLQISSGHHSGSLLLALLTASCQVVSYSAGKIIQKDAEACSRLPARTRGLESDST